MNSALQFGMHKGIHSRGYLPHWDFAGSVQAITFRLGDSLPADVIHEWRKELNADLKSADSKVSLAAQMEIHKRIARFEDAGKGQCVLARADCAEIVQAAILQGHGAEYKLIDWVIMPNHVHVLVRLLNDTPLGDIVKRWKASSAVAINRLLGKNGSLWMCDYHDRLIRDMDHLENARAYIRKNPVKAGLCDKPEDWFYSSAGQNWSAEFIPQAEERAAE
ncbi:MAG: transposase [Akkermansiaceae bacterium]|jgi:REP element-mobilizing transposase RayT|nr:transposase [Akkermansiaceae bacterium]